MSVTWFKIADRETFENTELFDLDLPVLVNALAVRLLLSNARAENFPEYGDQVALVLYDDNVIRVPEVGSVSISLAGNHALEWEDGDLLLGVKDAS